MPLPFVMDWSMIPYYGPLDPFPSLNGTPSLRIYHGPERRYARMSYSPYFRWRP